MIFPADAPVAPEAPAEGQEDSSAASGKRWRGRRHRRGGRGQAEGRTAPEQGLEITAEPSEESEVAPEIQASAHHSGDQPAASSWSDAAPREPRAATASPVPFVLPGESLSKYGGTTAEEAAKAAPEAAPPARPSGFSKPSTLIEAPLEWDGSGLLPGESISKHRSREAEPEVEAEPLEAVSATAPDHVEEDEFAEEFEEFDHEPARGCTRV